MRLADQILPQAKKKFGEDSISLDGLSEISYYVDTCSTGLTHAIGRPGYPSGRLTVIQGKESSGKTSLAIQAMGTVQAAGGVTIYLECESAFEADRGAQLGLYTEKYCDELGLDVEPLVILKPAHIKEAFSMIEWHIKKYRAIDPDVQIIICWDSVAATPSTTEASDENENYDKIAPGEPARQVSGGFRRLTGIVNKYQVVLLCLNFIKEKIGQSFPGADNTATIAQKPLGQHASVRIVLTSMNLPGKKRSESVGVKVIAKVNKNKIAPPHREAEFNFLYTKGVDNESWLLEAAKARSIIKGSGQHLTYEGEKFRKQDWLKATFHDEVVELVKQRLTAETTDLLGTWSPTKDEDDADFEEDDEEYGPVPKSVKVDDDDE